MKKLIFLLVFIFLLVLFNSYYCNAQNYVPGEMLIKVKPGIELTVEKFENNVAKTSYSSIDNLNEKYKVQDVKKIFKNLKPIPEAQNLNRIYKFKLPEDVDLLTVIEEYKKDLNVEYAEPNYIRKIFVTTPNDENFSDQWSLNQVSDHDIDAPESWDVELGESDVIIAIVDTGVDWNHPDLVDKIWSNIDEIPNNGFDDDNNGYKDDVRGWDFVDTDRPCFPEEDCTVRDNNPMDFHGHGTHCSGIAAAKTNNIIGIAGVCWNCKIMSVRAGYKGTDGNGYIDDEDAVDAIMYAADNGANIISMSFGDSTPSFTLESALNYAYSQDVFLVAAAGNYNTDIVHYPAGYDNVMAVAATDEYDSRASFSNYGDWIDVAAPGFGIRSTYFDNTYAYKSGTSMATPMVAGLAGLLKSRKSNLNNQEIFDLIKINVDEITQDEPIGSGRINAYKAVEALNCIYMEGTSTTCAIFFKYPETIWCDGNTAKECDVDCQYSEETCRTDIEDTDGGKIDYMKGICTEYNGCSDGICLKNSYPDKCGCFTFETSPFKIMKCFGISSESLCKNDPDCVWGLFEYYKNPKCIFEFKVCENTVCLRGSCLRRGGCPLLKTWNGENFVEVETLDIHAPRGEDTVYSLPVNIKPIDGQYKIILTEASYLLWEGSHIDNVKLIDKEGKECEMISAVHSKDEDVLTQLIDSDDLRIETMPGEELKLTFEGCEGEDFEFSVEGYNPWYRSLKLSLSTTSIIATLITIIVLVAIFGIFKFYVKR